MRRKTCRKCRTECRSHRVICRKCKTECHRHRDICRRCRMECRSQVTQDVRGKDLENVIGRSWMGIFASVLIFISFVLFAVVLAPFITDNIKMAAMYIVSIALTAFGLIKLRGQKNKTYLAISGCGVGCNLYFAASKQYLL